MRLPPAKEFELLWAEFGGPELTPEFRFAPPRTWRADFAVPEAEVLIEIEGGTWVQGRHSRPQGYANDCVKYNTATLLGYRVFRFTTDMVCEEFIRPVIELVRCRV